MASGRVPGEGATTVVSVSYIVAAEAEHGPITVEEIEVKRQQFAQLLAGGRPCSPPSPTTSGCCAVTS